MVYYRMGAVKRASTPCLHLVLNMLTTAGLRCTVVGSTALPRRAYHLTGLGLVPLASSLIHVQDSMRATAGSSCTAHMKSLLWQSRRVAPDDCCDLCVFQQS